MLFTGRTLVAFLQARRRKGRRPCAPGEIYCVRCRKPQTPAGNRVTYVEMTPDRGNLVGKCPVCDAGLYRRVSLAKLTVSRGSLQVSMPEALQHIDESN